MSSLFDPTLGLSQFQLPPQDIRLLSFCESNKLARLKNWADALKLTQINPASVALYRAVPEVVRLQTDVKTRFEMLECLWQPIQQCLQGLCKEFLQQPLILPEKPRNAAILAQALQKHLVDGYSICIRELIGQKRLKGGQSELFCQAIARSIDAISIIVLRAYQLYANVPNKLWLRAHVLYQIAEFYDIHQQALLKGTCEEQNLRTIKDIYVRLIALGCSRPNQLSQNDILKTYQALGQWASNIRMMPSSTADPNNFFLVDLQQDSAPINKSRFEGSPDNHLLEINFQALVGQLSKLSGSKSDDDWGSRAGIVMPPEINDSLLAHMLDCWSNATQRYQERKRSENEAEVCIGMIDCHYHLCGAIDFQDFLHPKSQLDDDFLSDGFDNLLANMGKQNQPADKPKVIKQTIYRTVIQNLSAGGFCLLWRGELPNKLESGELIGLREKGRRSWSVGVIRWVRQLKDASQLGVQLLTDQPVPYGAAVTYDMGGYSDHMRAIHIPAPIMPDQPPSLLTAPMPFQENSRVKLKQDEHNVEIRLKKCLFSTSKIRLFSFDTLESNDDHGF